MNQRKESIVVQFPIRHGELVRLTTTKVLGSTIPAGTIGHVLAMKVTDNKPEYLIKWRGRSHPAVAWLSELERV